MLSSRTTTLFLILSLFITVHPSFVHAADVYRNAFSIDAGYRVDDLDWNIAGDINGSNPNILSELTWKDLKIFQVRTTGKVFVARGLLIEGRLGYGWIYDGTNRDSDYLSDNRTGEFSRSDNRADSGQVLDASIGLGYMFIFGEGYGIMHFTPLVGYSHSEQDLTITEGFQTIPYTGPFAGLNSSYDTRWSGPWVGAEVLFDFGEANITGLFEYHWADYYAEANWNLRTDFAHPKSFEHVADGNGIVIALDWNVALAENILLSAGIEYRNWSTDHGIDRTFFASGATSETRLNEVNWKSTAFTGAIVFTL